MSNARSPRDDDSTTIGTSGMAPPFNCNHTVARTDATIRATMELHDDQPLLDECRAVRRELVLPFPRDEAWPLLGDPAELETWYAEDVDLEIAEGARGTLRLAEG